MKFMKNCKKKRQGGEKGIWSDRVGKFDQIEYMHVWKYHNEPPLFYK
jgi:hypothetical protein